MRTKNATFSIIGLCLVSMIAAMAASAASASEKAEGSNLFAGDLGNVFWTLLIFGLVVVALGRFAWGPILNNLQAREDFIHASLAKAAEERDSAEARLAEYERLLTTARSEATALVEEGRRDAEISRQRIEKEAQVESEKTLARAKREIELAKEGAIRELYSASGDMATEIAGRILGKELDAASHRQLITDAIKELGAMAPITERDAKLPS